MPTFQSVPEAFFSGTAGRRSAVAIGRLPPITATGHSAGRSCPALGVQPFVWSSRSVKSRSSIRGSVQFKTFSRTPSGCSRRRQVVGTGETLDRGADVLVTRRGGKVARPGSLTVMGLPSGPVGFWMVMVLEPATAR